MNEHIQFGTDGWRAVISDEFTIRNVERLAQATCEVIRETTKSKLVLIGYDRRFFSSKFAAAAARVVAGNKLKAEFSDGPITSPVLSAAVKARKAAIGIMITASHNPYYFNGFKLKGPHGGSVDAELTNRIEVRLDRSPVLISSTDIPRTRFTPGYYEFLQKFVRLETIFQNKGLFVFDAMHGPGGDLLEGLLGSKIHPVYVRKEPDPLFGGGAPEPIEANLGPLKDAVIKNRALAGLAVDGDGDRIGVVDDKGRYLPPHTVMPLLILHMIENRKLKGKIVQTVSMGYLPGRIARHFNLEFEETAVGFKYIARKMAEGKVLLGGEESGGYGVGLWSPERDGILCALLLMEMMADLKKPLSQLVDDMKRRFGDSHFKRVDFGLARPVDKTVWTANIKSHLNQSLGSVAIKSVNDIDGLKITTADDSWILMRPSGTEPLIRTYAEGTNTKVVEELLREAERLIQLPPPLTPEELAAQAKKRKKAKARAKR